MSTQHYLAQIRDPIHLTHAALSFASVISYPNLDVEKYILRTRELAEKCDSQIPDHLSSQARGIVLARLLFGAGGFHGNTANYYDPQNSFLNDVLDRKLGIPISLSVLFMEVGRLLALDVRGVALPGHFITSLPGAEGPLYIDPFHGGRTLTTSACELLVRRMSDRKIRFNPQWLEPVSEINILARMLANLRVIFLQRQNWEKTLQVLELLQITQPDVHGHTRDIGLVHNHIGNRGRAIYYLEAYLMRSFQAQDAAAVRAKLNELVRKRAQAN